MLNLNRYRERAAYDSAAPGGASTGVSGHEAYLRYGVVASAVLERVGGRILWHAPVGATVIGEGEERFDDLIAVWYPSAAAFLALITEAEYLESRDDRLEGLERAVLLRCHAADDPVLAAPEAAS